MAKLGRRTQDPLTTEIVNQINPPENQLEEARKNDTALNDELTRYEEDKEDLVGLNPQKAQRVEIQEAFEYINAKKELLEHLDKKEAEDPATFRYIKRAAKGALGVGVSVLDKTTRVLNFVNALNTGVLVGTRRQLSGEGTVTEGISEQLRENGGWDKVLKEFYKSPLDIAIGGGVGIISGTPEIELPRLVTASPSTMLRILRVSGPKTGFVGYSEGVRKGLKEGKTLVESMGFKQFGPVITTRGVVGFGLDVLADPLTYLSLGASVVEKATVKASERGVVKFAGKTLLTEAQAIKAQEKVFGEIRPVFMDSLPNLAKKWEGQKEILDNLSQMRVTRAGQKTLEMVDQFSAYMLGDKIIDGAFNVKSWFVKAKGPISDMLEKAVYFTRRTIHATERAVYERAQGIADDEMLDYFETMFKLNRKQARLAKKLNISKREAGKRIKMPEFKNPKLKAFHEHYMGKQGEWGELQKLAIRAGLDEDELFDFYIPSVFEEAYRDTIRPKGGKRYLGRLDAGFLKKEFIEKGLIKDPRVAIARRMVGLQKMVIHNETVAKVIKKYGKSFKSLDEAIDRGYQDITGELFRIDGRRARFGEVEKEFMDKGFGKLDETAVLKRLKRGPKANKGLDSLDNTFLPARVLKELKEVNKHFLFEKNAFLRFYDKKFLNHWKMYVTSIWPAFHGRNFISNQFLRYTNEGKRAFNFGDWWKAKRVLQNTKGLGDGFIQVSSKVDKAGKPIKISLKKLRKWMEQDGVIGTTSQLKGDIQEIFQPKGVDKFFEWTREVGAFVEDHARVSSYIAAIKDGFSRKQAKEIVFNGLFDYSNLTWVEKNVFKRIIPFYTFSRKNIALQLKTLFTNPGRQANVLKLFNDLQNEGLKGFSPKQKEAILELKKDYLKNMFTIPTGVTPDGEIMFMSGFGAPQEEVISQFESKEFFDNASFMLTPLLKLPGIIGVKDTYNLSEANILFKYYLKSDMNKSTFEKFVNSKDFQENPLNKIFDFSVQDREIYKDGKPTGERELYLRANPKMVYLFRTFATARAMSFLRTLGNKHMDDADQLVKHITGVSFSQYNLEDEARIRGRKIKKALGEELKRQGIGTEAFGKIIPFKNSPKRDVAQDLARRTRDL